MNEQEASDLAAGINLLDNAYADYYKRSDGHGKSYEASVSVEYGNYFDRNAGHTGIKGVRVATYVYGRRGREEWFDTVAEFLEWAEAVHGEQLALNGTTSWATLPGRQGVVPHGPDVGQPGAGQGRGAGRQADGVVAGRAEQVEEAS